MASTRGKKEERMHENRSAIEVLQQHCCLEVVVRPALEAIACFVDSLIHLQKAEVMCPLAERHTHDEW